ncbi:MAG: FxsA family protein [Candidatus Omnitrophica bacterium]|nr:FxsA family protein [Candidatus Omnitrophota bacterium]
MLGYLILFFTLVPLAELALLIKAGQHIGLGPTLLIVVFTGVMGAYLARLEGLGVLRRIEKEVNQGMLPADEVFNGVIIFCSGLLLLTPGFLTDFIGFYGLIPFTRNLFKKFLKRKIQNIVDDGRVITITSFRSK